MQRIQHILYVVPENPSSDSILNKVLHFATKKHAHVTFLNVIQKIPDEMHRIVSGYKNIDLGKALEKEATANIERVLKRRKKFKYAIKVVMGDKYQLTLNELNRREYDLLVTSQFEGKRSLKERIFGSQHFFLLRHSPNPVLIFRPGRSKQKYRMLIAIDTENLTPQKRALNRKIFDYAFGVGIYDNVEIHLIQCWKLYGESSFRSGFARLPANELDALLKETRAHYQQELDLLIESLPKTDFAILPKLLKGEPADVIPKYVTKNKIDMVVIGTVSRGGMAGVTIGNTAEDILQQVDCSVLVVKPDVNA